MADRVEAAAGNHRRRPDRPFQSQLPEDLAASRVAADEDPRVPDRIDAAAVDHRADVLAAEAAFFPEELNAPPCGIETQGAQPAGGEVDAVACRRGRGERRTVRLVVERHLAGPRLHARQP